MKESQHTGNAEQHRATPQQWLAMEVDSHSFATASTILELRDRVEALEAKDEDDKIDWTKMRRPGRSQGERIASLVRRIETLERDLQAILDSSSRLRVGLHDSPAKPNYPAKPDSSLVDQVEDALDMAQGDSKAKARAAIREAAAWLREEGYGFPAGKLEEEAMQ